MTRSDRLIAGIVVAAGSGERLGGGRPKALVEIDGVPIWRKGADLLRDVGCQPVIVVAPPKFEDTMRDGDVIVVPGGATRQQSVYKGLQKLVESKPGIVLVHDAARALTPVAVVANVVTAVITGRDAVAPAIPVADTVRQLGKSGSTLLDRQLLRAVQTPQGFTFDTLWQAHQAAAKDGFEATDDVSLCERQGVVVTLVDGDPLAFKITTPQDLAMARALAAPLRGI